MNIDLFFKIGMWWRIFYGTLRLIFGIALFRLIGTPVIEIFYKLAGKELVEDPNDLLIQMIGPWIGHFALTITYFLVIYLIFWGIIDIALSISLLKHKHWAFPISIYLILLFVLYEIYRFFHTHSFVLAYIIFVDLILVWLINKEYKKLKLTHKLS